MSTTTTAKAVDFDAGNIHVENDPCPSRVSAVDNARHWETKDFAVSKIVTCEGEKRRSDLPRFGATGQIRLTDVDVGGAIDTDRLLNDFSVSKYFNRVHSGEVQIGNADSEVDKALERCIQSMYLGERCDATLRVKLRLRLNGLDHGLNDENNDWATIECKIHLESLLNAQPIYKWFAETKMDKAKEANSAAVRLFKTRRTFDAFHKFHLTLTLLSYVVEEEPADSMLSSEAVDLRLTCYGNLTACQFQFKNYGHVESLATKVLERHPDNVKLLYRRGVARLELGEFDAARADLVEAHRLDPSNKAINDKLGQLRIAQKKANDQLATGLKKMFA